MTYYFGATKNITLSPSQNNFAVTLPTGQYDVVLLANAQDILSPVSIQTGDRKVDVLKALVETNAGKWNKNTLPMWGEIKNLAIDPVTGFSQSHPVEMIRMVAKVDLDVDAAASTDFSLTDVRVYNYSSKGTLVPDLAPTQPAGGYAPITTPQVFEAADGLTPDGCHGLIYLYEAPAGNDTDLSTNTCLVVGGRYKGGAVTYYRIDFIKKENGQKVFLPLLRNNCYLVNITAVNSNGYATPEEALKSPPINMEAQLLDWTGNNMSNVVFDGSYMLGVSTNRMMFSADKAVIRSVYNKLIVNSTVPEGWSVDKITDASNNPNTAPWLTLDSAPTPAGEVFVYVEENTFSVGRTGYIHIRSGKLQQRIEVVQSAARGFGLEVMDKATWQEITTLNFDNIANQSKTFRLSWRPMDALVSIAITATNPGNAFSATGGLFTPPSPSKVSNGFFDYTVTTNHASSGELIRVDVTLTHGIDEMVKTLYIRQR